MTTKEINKSFRGAKLIFCRAGADTIDSVSKKCKASVKAFIIEELESGDLNVRFSRVGDTLFIDEKSWIEING